MDKGSEQGGGTFATEEPPAMMSGDSGSHPGNGGVVEGSLGSSCKKEGLWQ